MKDWKYEILEYLSNAREYLYKNSGIIILNRIYQIQYINQVIEKISGYEVNTVVGRDIFEVYPYLPANELKAGTQSVFEKKKALVSENMSFALPTGLIFSYKRVVEPITINGDIIGCKILIFDMEVSLLDRPEEESADLEINSLLNKNSEEIDIIEKIWPATPVIPKPPITGISVNTDRIRRMDIRDMSFPKNLRINNNSLPAFFSDYIHKTGFPVLLADHHGYISLCNQAFEIFIGYSDSDLIGLKVDDLYYEEGDSSDKANGENDNKYGRKNRFIGKRFIHRTGKILFANIYRFTFRTDEQSEPYTAIQLQDFGNKSIMKQCNCSYNPDKLCSEVYEIKADRQYVKEECVKEMVKDNEKAIKKEISIVIHDELGPKISGVQYILTHLKNTEIRNKSELNIYYTKIDRILNEANSLIRFFSNSLLHRSSGIFEQQAFDAIVRNMLAGFKKFYKIKYKVKVDSSFRFSIQEKRDLIYVLKELILNSLKHNSVSCCEIQISDNCVIYNDDGAPYAEEEKGDENTGQGLYIIRYRLRKIGWAFERKNNSTIGSRILLFRVKNIPEGRDYSR